MHKTPQGYFAWLVRTELKNAQKKFSHLNTAHEGIAVLREEYLELECEVFKKEQCVDSMLKECVHVAAMAMRFAIDLHLLSFDEEEY